MNGLDVNRIIVGDARHALKTLPPGCIDTVITSPPYYRLRDYQHVGQLGLENHVDEWVNELRLVAQGLARVLKPTGSLWLNLGDSFSRAVGDGAPPKGLLLAPERLALALTSDGWILRSKVIWAKPNPMPTSVRDRLACTWEVVYFFVRQRRYFFNLDAIRTPHQGRPRRAGKVRSAWSVPPRWRGPSSGSNDGLSRLKARGLPGHPAGKNPGDVWTIPTAGYRGAHHAVFPERLVERPLLATCPEWTCRSCGLPAGTTDALKCSCRAGRRAGVVLDPFIGSGTTALAAERHGRGWIGIELSPDIAALGRQRIAAARALTTSDQRAA